MEVKARMPGLILDVKVNDGDTVSARQVLAILEAMKMEQPIPAPQDGVVSVKVAKGDTVKSGQVLFEVA